MLRFFVGSRLALGRDLLFLKSLFDLNYETAIFFAAKSRFHKPLGLACGSYFRGSSFQPRLITNNQ